MWASIHTEMDQTIGVLSMEEETILEETWIIEKEENGTFSETFTNSVKNLNMKP